MRSRNFIPAICVAAVACPAASYGITVVVAASAPEVQTQIQDKIMHGENVAKWVEQIKQATETVRQAKAIYQQAQTIAGFINDPKAALRNLADVENVAAALAEIAGPNTDLATVFGEVSAMAGEGQSLMDAADDLKWEVGHFNANGQPRNVSLYQALVATGKLAAVTRDAIEQAKKEDDKRVKSIDDAVANATNGQGGMTDLMGAMARIQREGAVMQASHYRTQQMLWQQEQDRRAAEARAHAEYVARVEDIVAGSERERTNIDATDAAARRDGVRRLAARPADPLPDNSGIQVWVSPSAFDSMDKIKGEGANGAGQQSSGPTPPPTP